MAAEHQQHQQHQQQQRGPGIDGMSVNYPVEEATFSSTPYSAAQVQREQMQMQFQQQLQAQQQHVNQLQIQQSSIMEDIGPASSTLMQMHGGSTSAEMPITNVSMHHGMHTRSSDAAAAGRFVSTLQSRQQSNVKRGGTVITGGDEGVPQLYKTSKMRRPSCGSSSG
ncbi:hypothetical protein L915_10941 [Phytophthora nicotianae]|uniref:Uncharacterized protein n=1 Tax=Phytophthora nicotianae TaxID=4792 RepID=W2GM30_PHYNI|nr:hypothetical protein L915_10941 [Phytophthora nicotianae]